MFFPNITETPTEELMRDKEALDLYEKGMAFFHSQLEEMNINLYLVEQIISFPPILIEEWLPDNFYFLIKFVDNALNMSILTINKLINDDAKDLYTMTAFQQNIRKELLKPEKRAYFEEILANNRRGKKQVRDIQRRVKEFRDKRLAHLTNDFFKQSFDKTMQQTRLDFLEIRDLSFYVNYMFFSYAFGRGYTLLPPCYANYQPDHKTDIEAFLDGVAMNSKILNLPETDSERWKERKSTLTNEQLQEINRFRKKFNLGKV